MTDTRFGPVEERTFSGGHDDVSRVEVEVSTSVLKMRNFQCAEGTLYFQLQSLELRFLQTGRSRLDLSCHGFRGSLEKRIDELLERAYPHVSGANSEEGFGVWGGFPVGALGSGARHFPEGDVRGCEQLAAFRLSCEPRIPLWP